MNKYWIVVGLVASIISLSVKAQTNPPAWDYLPIPSQPSKYLNIQLGKQHENFMDGQAYVGSISNVSTEEVHVTGTIVAYLTCGNQVSSQFDVTLKPGESAGGGSPALLNMDGLGGHAMNTDCLGEKKYPDPKNNPTLYYFDRIRTVGITALSVNVISDKLVMRDDGASNGTKVKKNVASASSSTYYANNNSAQRKNENQAQMQQFTGGVTRRTQAGQNESTTQAVADLGGAVDGLISAISSRRESEKETIAKGIRSQQLYENNYILQNKDSNDPGVIYQVGLCYFVGGDNANSFYYFKKSAEMGNIKAMKELALVFYLGECGFKPHSVEDEKYWLAQAASKGNDIFSYYMLGWYSIPKDGNCQQNNTALLFFYKVESLCSQRMPKLTKETNAPSEEELASDNYNDYGAYCLTEKAIGDIISLCGEQNKTEKESLTDAIMHYKKSLEFGDVHYQYGFRFFHKKEIKKAISDDEKRLKQLGN